MSLDLEANKHDELIAKEIYLHFSDQYNKQNWLYNHPSWEKLPEGLRSFWVKQYKLAVHKNQVYKTSENVEQSQPSQQPTTVKSQSVGMMKAL